MDNKVTKSSFLLKKTMLPDIIQYLESYEILKTPQRKFQIFSGKIMNSDLLIYKSGIVVYEESHNLVKILQNYFTSIALPIPRELEATSQTLIKRRIKPNKTPLDSKTSSYWLSEEQIEHFLNLHNKSKYKIVTDVNNNIKIKICKSNINCLEISKKGLVKSNSISDYKSELDFVMENYPIDNQSDLFVGIESMGRYTQIGPMILTAIGINQQQSIQLQKEGIRHMKVGRYSDPSRYLKDLERKTVFLKTLILDPKEVNKVECNIDNMPEFIHFFQDVEKVIPSDDSVTVYYDTNIESDIQQFDFYSSVSTQRAGYSMSSAIASIIARNHFDNWVRERSQKYQMLINKGNLIQILDLPDKEKLVKMKYLSRSR